MEGVDSVLKLSTRVRIFFYIYPEANYRFNVRHPACFEGVRGVRVGALSIHLPCVLNSSTRGPQSILRTTKQSAEWKRTASLRFQVQETDFLVVLLLIRSRAKKTAKTGERRMENEERKTRSGALWCGAT